MKRPQKVDVTVVERIRVKRVFSVELESGWDEVQDGNHDRGKIHGRARAAANADPAIPSDSEWEIDDSDGMDFRAGQIEWDYDKMTSDEEATILHDIVAATNIRGILGIGMVGSLLREYWNNDVLDERESGETFERAFLRFASQLTAAQILSTGDVYGELREHFNNEILDKWVAVSD